MLDGKIEQADGGWIGPAVGGVAVAAGGAGVGASVGATVGGADGRHVGREAGGVPAAPLVGAASGAKGVGEAAVLGAAACGPPSTPGPAGLLLLGVEPGVGSAATPAAIVGLPLAVASRMGLGGARTKTTASPAPIGSPSQAAVFPRLSMLSA